MRRTGLDSTSRFGARSRLVRRAAGTAAAVLVTLLATSGTAIAGSWQYYELDGDYYSDAAVRDRDGNGTFDDLWFDLDNDGRWDSHLYNTRYADDLLEVVDYDMDENDEAELRLADGDQRVGFDYLYVDWDQDGYWDRTRGYGRRIIPGSNIDITTRSNRQNAGSTLIADFRRRTGTSLLYPSLPSPY